MPCGCDELLTYYYIVVAIVGVGAAWFMWLLFDLGLASLRDYEKDREMSDYIKSLSKEL